MFLFLISYHLENKLLFEKRILFFTSIIHSLATEKIEGVTDIAPIYSFFEIDQNVRNKNSNHGYFILYGPIEQIIILMK